ncbi:spondin domain-containing protein [Sungkyunkwania multivorans]|uniref:Spondin domain-containing protein n=1 Tax=Sungkyunkwania multivorans TaxID=1173618 RepID=A0ABW3D5F8_9FLAO
MIKKITLLFTTILLISSALWNVHAQSIARYDISFTSTWSNTTHPFAGFPSNAHWSDLVGATHNNSVTFVVPGQLASPGIEDVAELGSNGNFFNEVEDAINIDGTADRWLQASFSPFAAISTAALSGVEVSGNYPLLSLAAMIAPSPDWMIAVNSISLLDTNGDWIPSITLDLYPYDAGTEEGDTYSGSNPASSPQEVIFSRQNIAPFSNEKVGTLTITLDAILSTDEFDRDAFTVYPNPSNGIFKVASLRADPITEVQVYDLLGKKVRVENVNNQRELEFDYSALDAGIYLIRIISIEGNTSTRKIIIEN